MGIGSGGRGRKCQDSNDNRFEELHGRKTVLSSCNIVRTLSMYRAVGLQETNEIHLDFIPE
jgi:hypothetical protein